MTFCRLKSQSNGDTGVALARLDERIAGSPVGAGWIERMHFTDACASLWIEGELVHLEDLVLHNATKDIRTPTHELTIARNVLLSRRRIAGHPPGWALSPEGLNSLRGVGADTGRSVINDGGSRAPHAAAGLSIVGAGEELEVGDQDPLAANSRRSMQRWPDPRRPWPRRRRRVRHGRGTRIRRSMILTGMKTRGSTNGVLS